MDYDMIPTTDLEVDLLHYQRRQIMLLTMAIV